MMHWFAKVVLFNPGSAVLVATSFAMLSFMFPFANLLSGAAIGLVVLRNGLSDGMTAIVGSTIVTAIFSYFLLGQPFYAVGFLVGIWVPVLAMAIVLGRSRSLSKTLLLSSLVALAATIAIHLIVGDTSDLWQQWMQQLEPVFQQMPGEADVENLKQALNSVGDVIVGVIVVSLYISAILSLFVARSGQAVLFNPGGFQREFYSLRLGNFLLPPALVVGLVSLFADGAVAIIAKEVFLIFVVTFAIQGLAICHAIANPYKFGGFILSGVYICLVLSMFQFAMILAALGVIDHWFDFRSKIRSQSA